VYEGVEAKNYLKRYFLIQIKGKSYTCLFYQMRASRGIMPPNEQYIDTIAEGYADFGLDLADLDAALNEAWGTKDITQRLAEKHERRGRPRLARSILPLPDDPKEGRQGAKIDSKSGQLLLPPPMWTGRE
jgi:hypothetical protein